MKICQAQEEIVSMENQSVQEEIASMETQSIVSLLSTEHSHQQTQKGNPILFPQHVVVLEWESIMAMIQATMESMVHLLCRLDTEGCQSIGAMIVHMIK